MSNQWSKVAAPYAEALLQLAFASPGNEADLVLADLALINQTFSSTADLALILGHPSIAKSQKRKMLVELFAKQVQDLTMRLLELLLDKRRIPILSAIEFEYHKLLNARKNIITANLVCAEKLNENAVADIKARLTEHLGSGMELAVKVDPSLIGGLILRLGDQVIDGSLRGKLQNLERVLLKV